MGSAPNADDSLATGLVGAYARWRSKSLGQITDALERRLILELLEPRVGQSILDVGCGYGVFAVALAQKGAAVVGVDADSAMIAKARENADRAKVAVELIEGVAEGLPFPDATFERVLAVATLCLVDDAARAVGEMARVLAPGGRAVIGDLGQWSLWAAKRRISGLRGNPVWRKAHFRTSRDLRRLVEAAGLVVVETRGSIFYPPLGIAAQLLAPIDHWLGRWTTSGAAFIVLSATKPATAQRVATSPK